MRFHFRASIRPIFENHVLRAVSGPFHPLYEPKISNRSLSVVYGSITLKFFSGALGTSPHQGFNRGNKIQKKCFLGHPNIHRHLTNWDCFLLLLKKNWRRRKRNKRQMKSQKIISEIHKSQVLVFVILIFDLWNSPGFYLELPPGGPWLIYRSTCKIDCYC